MKHIKHIVSYSLVLLSFMTLQSQNQDRQLKKADKKFKNLAYVDAVKIYEEVISNGFEDANIYSKLGNAYYFNANYDEAGKWYEKLFALEPEQENIYNFRYGQCLKSEEKYELSDKYLRTYYRALGHKYVNSSLYLEDIEKASGYYTVKKATVNSKYSDYPGFLSGEDLYVISAENGAKKTDWNGEPTSDVFHTNGSNFLVDLKGKVNTPYNEGSLAITKDGSTMYFTRNDFQNLKLGRDKHKIVRLKIYRASRQGDSWGDIVELPFNSSEYSVGHPALSSDDSILYFVSDNDENSKGGTDIYKVDIFEDGTYGTPINMEHFNTPEDELFPFVDVNDTFYFASNGHSNLGGLDIFASKIDQEDRHYTEIYNVGRPVNSTFDDFAFVFDFQTNKGYFASNRPNTSSDDIFAFDKKACLVSVEGVVREQKTGTLIPHAFVSLLDEHNKVIQTTTSEASGRYTFDDVNCEDVRFVRAEKKDYVANELSFVPKNGMVFNEIALDRRIWTIIEDSDLADLLRPIYFDLDKSNIRNDEKVELEKIATILINNPNIVVAIESHTDSRASDTYNLELSKRRAYATRTYLFERGVPRRQIESAIGYGESQLINKCSNGVPCKEEEHSENRRSRFIVVKN